jgi:hypothetical protein
MASILVVKVWCVGHETKLAGASTFLNVCMKKYPKKTEKKKEKEKEKKKEPCIKFKISFPSCVLFLLFNCPQCLVKKK